MRLPFLFTTPVKCNWISKLYKLVLKLPTKQWFLNCDSDKCSRFWWLLLQIAWNLLLSRLIVVRLNMTMLILCNKLIHQLYFIRKYRQSQLGLLQCLYYGVHIRRHICVNEWIHSIIVGSMNQFRLSLSPNQMWRSSLRRTGSSLHLFIRTFASNAVCRGIHPAVNVEWYWW